MSNTLYYVLFALAALGVVISAEWDNISNVNTPDLKKIVVILLILFFLGTGLASLFR